MALSPPETCPGEISENAIREAARATGSEPETCRLLNDLTVAVEVDLGRGWQPLYPKSSLEVRDNDVSVRLRDDAEVCGFRRRSTLGSELLLSDGFGDFGRLLRLQLNFKLFGVSFFRINNIKV